MKHFLRPEAWAPLLGYLFLVTVLLLVANGIAWLSLLDESGRAIINLRLYLLIGLFGSTFSLVLLPQSDTRQKSSRSGIIGSALMFVGFLSCVISMPELFNNPYVLHGGAVLVGIGFGKIMQSSLYFIKRIKPREFLALFVLTSIAAILLYSIIDGCPQFLGIILILAMPCLSIFLFGGIFPKYDVSSPCFPNTSPCEHLNHNDTESRGRQISQISFGLLVFIIGYFIQQNWALR